MPVAYFFVHFVQVMTSDLFQIVEHCDCNTTRISDLNTKDMDDTLKGYVQFKEDSKPRLMHFWIHCTHIFDISCFTLFDVNKSEYSMWF